MSYSIRVVATPAGKCPVKLKSADREEVIEWSKEVYSAGIAENINYLPSAFCFFAQQFFNIFSDEYKSICNHINLAYNVDKTEFYELIGKINVEEKQNKIDKKKRREEAEKLENQKKNERKNAKKIESKIEIVQEEPKKKIKLRRK
jgi:hypothetical protein